MLVGKTPYFSSDKSQLIDNIENAELYFPRTLSNYAKSLILQLMDRDPCQRLGASAKDAEAIKEHVFFRDIDWNKVLKKEYEVPKPDILPINNFGKFELSGSIFNDLLQKDVQISCKDNVPGWSFIKP